MGQIAGADDEPSSNRDRCAGSREYALPDDMTFADGVWTGLCPVCGLRLELGYAGLLPDHRPPSPVEPNAA